MQERIAILGAGAVGCYFGGMLARAGVPVTLIGRPQHIDAIGRDGLFIERDDFQEYVKVRAATDVEAARGASIVLFSVKTTDTEAAAAGVKPYMDEGALLLSMQNGVDNVERIRSATGIDAIPAVVYVAVAMSGPGKVKHSGRGDLIIGELSQQPGRGKRLDRVSESFSSAGITCRISKNIASELWTKLVMNCTYNPISALGRSQYALIKENALTRDLMRQITEEVVAVAGAARVPLPSSDHLMTAVLSLGDTMANATSSTAQDIARGKLTEIDSLNGYVARRGRELGVPTPVNGAMHALVKLLEISDKRSE